MIQGASHGGAQPSQVAAAVVLGDVIGKAECILLIGVVPLHAELDGDAVALGGDVNWRRMQRGFAAVQVFDERLYPALVLENILFAAALIRQGDPHPGIEKGKFA